jgi:SET domain-containing protein
MNNVPTKRQKPCMHHPWPVPMEVKPSAIEGRGLFTKVPLRARQKIGEFTGERITQYEGRKRAKTRKQIAIVEINNGKAIDAGKETTGFRFINHSCSPNTFLRIIRERAEFYTLHPITAGTELTVNCHPSHHNNTLRCKCGSAICRQFL